MKIKKNLIIIGAGSHSESLLELIDKKKFNIIGYIDKNLNKSNVIGNDQFLLNKKKNNFVLLNGIYFNFGKNLRIRLFEKLKNKKYRFINLISKNSILSKHTQINEGSQILNGVIINKGVIIGYNSIINTGSIIEHDTIVGNHCTISPGCKICGNVNIEDNVNLGPGVTIFNNIKIGKNSFIQGGTTIKKSVKANSIIYNKNAI